MKILAFAASSSRQSINKTLAAYAASLVPGAEVEVLDINDYEMPLFSEDKEKELGKPEAAQRFYAKIGAADALVIAFAEHNGSYTSAFKNLFDWTSRYERNLYQNKPMVMLATSPGPGGGKNVLQTAVTSAPFFAGDVKAHLSVPEFYKIFDQEQKVLTDDHLKQQLVDAVGLLVG